jgi:EAL domain-containing protein (putative c-di-GMP-specific phosphodiesterase class I)
MEGPIMSDVKSRQDRDTSYGGAWNRAQFELSLKSVRAFGFSPRIAEHCRDRARATGRLPHEIVIEIVEGEIAG